MTNRLAPGRGNPGDRRRRKLYVLTKFGDGTVAECRLHLSPNCLGELDINTVTIDRILPGCLGGTYDKDNVQPGCNPCQQVQSQILRKARM